MRFIGEFYEGERILGHYLCRKKELLKTKAGKGYLSLVLQDKTGSIAAKIWDIGNDIQDFEAGDFVKIDGDVTAYRDALELRVAKIRQSRADEYQPADYIPTTDKDIPEMMAQIGDLIDSIHNFHIKELVQNIYNIPEIRETLPSHSAAQHMHHAYWGGLCEHTLSVAQICEFLAPRYKFVNRDLLLAAALLHDIGKIFEISPFPENEYTDEGQLIGHIVDTARIIREQAAKIPGFPPRLETMLTHCIISHHGRLEWGAPKEPRLIEAAILHEADHADATIKMYEEALQAAPAKSNWSNYHRVLGRSISKTNF